MKLSENKDRQSQHLIVFGANKTGKSTLVSKLALAGFKLIWISLDGGHVVLYKLPQDAQERIDLISIPDTRKYPIGIQTCIALLEREPQHLCHMHGIHNCSVCKTANQSFSDYDFNKIGLDTIVVLDHCTQLSDSCQSSITKNKPIDYKLELDDWGSLRFHLLRVMMTLQVAPYHVACISQEGEAELEDSSKRLLPQIGSREFHRNVGSYFDHMVHCSVMNTKHRFISNSTSQSNIVCGSRMDHDISKYFDRKSPLTPFFTSMAEKSDDEIKTILEKLRAGG